MDNARASEPTTWQTCWGETGALLIDDECKGRPTREIVWPKSQIRIVLSAHLPAAHRDAARWAMVVWNEWLDREMFVETVIAHDVQVVPAMWSGRTIGMAIHRREAGEMVGVVFASVLTTDNLDRLYAHEFGHMLGLAHDPDEKLSIMYPYMIGERYELRFPDRQALMRLYGRP